MDYHLALLGVLIVISFVVNQVAVIEERSKKTSEECKKLEHQLADGEKEKRNIEKKYAQVCDAFNFKRDFSQFAYAQGKIPINRHCSDTSLSFSRGK